MFLIFDAIDMDESLRDINLVIAAVTNITSFYVCIVMFYWWRRLRNTTTNLRPLIMAISLAKGALWFWSGTGVLQIVAFDIIQPLITLPARLVFMFAALLQAHLTTKYYKIDDEPDPPGPFEKVSL